MFDKESFEMLATSKLGRYELTQMIDSAKKPSLWQSLKMKFHL